MRGLGNEGKYDQDVLCIYKIIHPSLFSFLFFFLVKSICICFSFEDDLLCCTFAI